MKCWLQSPWHPSWIAIYPEYKAQSLIDFQQSLLQDNFDETNSNWWQHNLACTGRALVQVILTRQRRHLMENGWPVDLGQKFGDQIVKLMRISCQKTRNLQHDNLCLHYGENKFHGLTGLYFEWPLFHKFASITSDSYFIVFYY